MKPRRSIPRLRLPFAAVPAFSLLAVTLFAQAIAPDAATLAKYDANKNGRLDPEELAAMASAKPGPKTGAASADAAPEVVTLSPFEVKADTNGYYASNTMSGTRLNAKLEDVTASISVVTKQQMADFAMLDLNDIFAYEAGTEGTGNYTDYEIDRSGQVSDRIMDNPQGANRVRGMTAANISLSGFATSGRVPVDPINSDAVEISRGPNSNIFGLGEGSGTVNMVGASANLNRASTTAQLRFDDLGGWRTSLDLNRPLIKNKLSLRLSGVRQHDAFVRKPSGYDTRRFNAMVRAQPFRYTTVRASFQSVRSSGTRANSITPRDGVSDWMRNGSPTWDPVTSTVTVRGVSTVMGTTNPTSLAPHDIVDPILYVDRNGIAEPVNYETPYVRDAYRGQLAYIADFRKGASKWTRLLGRHQFLGYYEERKTKNFAYRSSTRSSSRPSPSRAPPRASRARRSANGASTSTPATASRGSPNTSSSAMSPWVGRCGGKAAARSATTASPSMAALKRRPHSIPSARFTIALTPTSTASPATARASSATRFARAFSST